MRNLPSTVSAAETAGFEGVIRSSAQPDIRASASLSKQPLGW
ncbi:hypothetical protein P3T25_009812 [Paraburkholderia sp. GAS32]